MMKEPHSYSRRSLRLPDYDYSLPGIYFLTLGTFRRDDLFGQVVDGAMELNEGGKIVRDKWLGLPQRFPNVALDEMVVMPNHLHGIAIVRKVTNSVAALEVAAIDVAAIHELPLPESEQPLRQDEMPLSRIELPQHNEIPLHENDFLLPEDILPLPKESQYPPLQIQEQYRLHRRRMLIPRLVGYFKMNTAKAINQLLGSPGVPVWQRNYYEHVIHTGAELVRIRRYIRDNPMNWEKEVERSDTKWN